jgi:hypothetical protein
MIKINLLPVREERRRMGAKQEQMFFALIMVLTLIGVYYWHSQGSADTDHPGGAGYHPAQQDRQGSGKIQGGQKDPRGQDRRYR